MTQIYLRAIELVLKRVKSCGVALSNVTDEYSVSYWNLELAKANYLKLKIRKRLKLNHNVIKIDFVSKRKVA